VTAQKRVAGSAFHVGELFDVSSNSAVCSELFCVVL